MNVSITEGAYSVNGGAYTSAAGTVINGQTIQVRLKSSNLFSTTNSTTLTVGDLSRSFTVTTGVADTTPDAFSFTAQTGVPPGTTVTSNSITVSGINSNAAISITGGEYRVGNTGPFKTQNGTVSNGDTVTVRLTASSNFSTPTVATLTIGGVSATFSVTTATADTIPDAFSFTSQANVYPGSTATSNSVTVSGINTSSAVSISGGTYSINGGAYTSAAGSVTNGQTITVRVVASSSYLSTTSATVTIGGVTGTFSVTSQTVDTSPDAFSFPSRTRVQLSSTITSETITISGINAAASIAVVNGMYSINGGAYTSSAGTITNGQTVSVQHTSSASRTTSVTTTLTIGGVSGTFTSTTR